MYSRVKRASRSRVTLILLFAVPPAIGTALATLRVTGGESTELAALFGVLIGVGIAGFLLLLTLSGEAEEPPIHSE